METRKHLELIINFQFPIGNFRLWFCEIEMSYFYIALKGINEDRTVGKTAFQLSCCGIKDRRKICRFNEFSLKLLFGVCVKVYKNNTARSFSSNRSYFPQYKAINTHCTTSTCPKLTSILNRNDLDIKTCRDIKLETTKIGS